GSLKHANVFRYIVTELRAFLRTNGLPVSGRKADLIERILEHLSSSEASEEEEESGKTDNQRSHSWESEEEKEEENDEPSIDHNQEESEGESDNDDDDEESDEPEPYVSDPDFAKLLRKLGSGAQDRGSPVPMQHLNQFQQKLGNNVQGCKIWLPDDLRQLYRFANGFKLELEDVSEVLPLDEVSDAPNQGTKTHHDLPLERCHMDDEDDVEHPAWIPFAMNGDYECYLVNANYGARTYGQ
ncbi:SAP domain containing protein, partial [Acanthamoeba castellanii str. Neff]